ncbi:acyltransferase family protein [Rothia sp. P7181]|uniref:acyltransferase family protein n=1 Tax=Rothia sp. P7181 TaxID=3402663 RepID=UPI003AE00C67
MSKTPRNYSIDAIRGFALILVVLGHANVGVVSAGLAVGNTFLSQLNAALYLVHMPLFAFLMGLNMSAASRRHPHPQYLWNRVITFGYLYFLWTLIQGSFQVLGSSASNSDTSWIDVINLWHPLAHLWYLPWAAIVFCILLSIQPWRNRATSYLLMVLLLLVMLLSWGIDGKSIPERGMSLLFITALGAVLGIERLTQKIMKLHSFVLIIFAICFGALYLYIAFSSVTTTRPTSADPHRTLSSIGMGMAASYAGMVAIIMFFSYLYRWRRIRVLEYLGKTSLPIYLMHLMFTPTTRVLLAKIGVDNPYIIDIFATLAGIILPVLIVYMTRLRMPWLYEPPTILLPSGSGYGYKPKHSR